MSALLRASRAIAAAAARPTLTAAPRLSVNMAMRAFAAAPVPADCKYTESHEWIKVVDGVGVVGITDHAQEEMGEIVHTELPEVSKTYESGEAAGAVESVKATSDIKMPVTGEVIEVNSTLVDSPELINQGPHEEGWMFKVKISDTAQVDSMLSKEDYEKILE